MDANNNSTITKIIAAIITLLVCCACAAIIVAGAIFYRTYQQKPFNVSPQFFPTEVPAIPEVIPTLDRSNAESVTAETVNTLNQAPVPENDPYDLACRLQKKCN